MPSKGSPPSPVPATSPCSSRAASCPISSITRPTELPTRPNHCIRQGRRSPANSQPASSMETGVEPVIRAAAQADTPSCCPLARKPQPMSTMKTASHTACSTSARVGRFQCPVTSRSNDRSAPASSIREPASRKGPSASRHHLMAT